MSSLRDLRGQVLNHDIRAWMRMPRAFWFLLAVTVAGCSDGEVPTDQKANIGLAESLQHWLSVNETYRLATAEDCSCKAEIEELSKRGAAKQHPYELRGDFDNDAREDLAVTVVNSVDPLDHLVLVFTPSSADERTPVVFRRVLNESLAGIGLFKSKGTNGGDVLLFGAFNSEGEPLILPTPTAK